MIRKYFLAPLFLFLAATVLAVPAHSALPIPAPVFTEKIDMAPAPVPFAALRCEAKRVSVTVKRPGHIARSPDRTGKLVADIAAGYPNHRALKVPWCG